MLDWWKLTELDHPIHSYPLKYFKRWNTEAVDIFWSRLKHKTQKLLCHWCSGSIKFCDPHQLLFWTWEAYCKFQRTSSIDGRLHDSVDIHLLVIEITIDRDSLQQVACTTGSTICFHSSWLLKEACNWSMLN